MCHLLLRALEIYSHSCIGLFIGGIARVDQLTTEGEVHRDVYKQYRAKLACLCGASARFHTLYAVFYLSSMFGTPAWHLVNVSIAQACFALRMSLRSLARHLQLLILPLFCRLYWMNQTIRRPSGGCLPPRTSSPQTLAIRLE